MAEKKDDGVKKKKEFNPDDRFKYIGFDVHQGKIRDFFKSDSEKESWIKRVLEKRKAGSRLRDESSFDQPRVAGYEKIVLTITSLMLIASLFLPWFSGYTEHEVEAAPAPAEEVAVADSMMVDSLADSLTMAAGEAEEVAAAEMTTDETINSESEAGAEGEGSSHMTLDKDDKGFASITAIRKRKEIRRDYEGYSAIKSIAMMGSAGGAVFSSGFILIITAILIIVYMLLCLGSAGYTIYMLYGQKGNDDVKALKLKKALRINWVPVMIWGFCLIISFFGATYSFDSTGMISQIGDHYGISTYLSILSYGFYISLACFIMNAVKAVEI